MLGVPFLRSKCIRDRSRYFFCIMPFSTDANWPQGLLDIFDISCNQNAPLKSRYYGPYDRLFNYAVVEGCS